MSPGGAAAGADDEMDLADIVDRASVAMDHAQDLMRAALPQRLAVDGDGGEGRMGMAGLAHIVEADQSEVAAGLQPPGREPIQYAEGDNIVEAESRRRGLRHGEQPFDPGQP